MLLRIVYSIVFYILVEPVLAEQIRVGAILPLSGTVAPWGQQLRIGLETANELQGQRFSFVYEDEGPCIGRNALTAYRNLINQGNIKIIFLGCLSGAEAIAPIAAKEDVLLLSLGLLNESALSAGAKLVDLATDRIGDLKSLNTIRVLEDLGVK